MRSCLLPQPLLGSGQSQRGSLPVAPPLPVSPSPRFDRSPSAARQLQIIALSSARQPLSGPYAHTVPPSPHELLVQPKRTTSNEDSAPPLPPSSALPRAASSTPSPPSTLSPPSPPSQATPSSEEKRDGGQGARREGKGGGGGGGEGGGGGGSPDLKVEDRGSDQRHELKEAKEEQNEQEVAASAEEEVMEVTEEGQTKVDDVMDQSEGPEQNLIAEEPARASAEEPQQLLDQVPTQALVPVAAAPVQDAPIQAQKQPDHHRDSQRDPQRDPQPVASEDFCENMSTQSDNQSGDLTAAD